MISCVDLFCGVGGLTQGLAMRGKARSGHAAQDRVATVLFVKRLWYIFTNFLPVAVATSADVSPSH